MICCGADFVFVVYLLMEGIVPMFMYIFTFRHGLGHILFFHSLGGDALYYSLR